MKKAFTLAEVLVVIGIIGMIADLTLPNLIQNYQKQIYVTKLKKAYTVFNQALIQMSADMDCPGDLKCTGVFDDFNEWARSNKFGEEITKYMKVIKTANAGEITAGWEVKGSINYDGSNLRQNIYYAYDYKFITIDGVLYAFVSNSRNCSYSKSDLKNICAFGIIDINGLEPPNYYGRDIFYFYIISDGPALYPHGGQKFEWWKDSDTGQPKTCYPGNTYGYSCFGRIMEEGWQMNY